MALRSNRICSGVSPRHAPIWVWGERPKPLLPMRDGLAGNDLIADLYHGPLDVGVQDMRSVGPGKDDNARGR